MPEHPAALPEASLRPVRAVIGFALALVVYALCRYVFEIDHLASVTAGVTALCAAWWCTEAVPIPVTSIVPFAVFPLFGVLNSTQLAEAYGDKFVLLFMGGFMLSRAAEKSNTHLRVAHGMMRIVGSDSPRRIVVGFMLATAVCSMWISNTATALIMLPVAIAVIAERPGEPRFAVSLLLAIAYGSSVGGIATIVGTPPNGVFVSVYETTTARTVTFTEWMAVGVPIAVLMLIAVGLVLTLRLRPQAVTASPDQTVGGLIELGPWTPAQRRTLLVIGLTALAWITRKSPGGGWSGWLDTPLAQDATVALFAVVVCFLIPSGEPSDQPGRRPTLLDWKSARDIPWGILLLFGGGIALAKAFQATGLANHIADALTVLSDLHPIVVIAIICLVVTFMTEVTSNTATTTLLMPILAASADAAGLDPAAFMVPAALSASCAFMLPVATPPNAIVFASDHITIPQMARVGFILNLIGAVIITLICYTLVDRTEGMGTPATPPPAAVAPAP